LTMCGPGTIARPSILQHAMVSAGKSQIYCWILWGKSETWQMPERNTAFVTLVKTVGMHRILFLPDIRSPWYPAIQKAVYRISGKGRIPDIR
jgi:hypothetical protein